jgi:hypothetical protein
MAHPHYQLSNPRVQKLFDLHYELNELCGLDENGEPNHPELGGPLASLGDAAGEILDVSFMCHETAAADEPDSIWSDDELQFIINAVEPLIELLKRNILG